MRPTVSFSSEWCEGWGSGFLHLSVSTLFHITALSSMLSTRAATRPEPPVTLADTTLDEVVAALNQAAVAPAASRADEACATFVGRRNSVRVTSSYQRQNTPEEEQLFRPDDTMTNSAFELLRQRGMMRSQHDLAKVAQARPYQFVHALLWDPARFTAQQIMDSGGQASHEPIKSTPVRSALPENYVHSSFTQRSTSSCLTVGPHGTDLPQSRLEIPPEQPIVRGASTAAVASILADRNAMYPLRKAVYELEAASQRRLVRLDARGVFTPRTNAARVTAEKRAKLRRRIIEHLDGAHRDTVRKRLGLPPLCGPPELTRGATGSNETIQALEVAETQSLHEDSDGAQPNYQRILRKSGSAVAVGSRLSTGTLGSRLISATSPSSKRQHELDPDGGRARGQRHSRRPSVPSHSSRRETHGGERPVTLDSASPGSVMHLSRNSNQRILGTEERAGDAALRQSRMMDTIAADSSSEHPTRGLQDGAMRGLSYSASAVTLSQPSRSTFEKRLTTMRRTQSQSNVLM
eukprot:scaffold1283_cov35-Tisochrysis_lutea.AAC.1